MLQRLGHGPDEGGEFLVSVFFGHLVPRIPLAEQALLPSILAHRTNGKRPQALELPHARKEMRNHRSRAAYYSPSVTFSF